MSEDLTTPTVEQPTEPLEAKSLLGSAAPKPAPTPAAPPTEPVKETSWRESLPEQLKGEKCFENIKDVSDLASQFLNAQKLIGAKKIEVPSFPIPKDDSPKEEWDKFYAAVGRPESPDGYELYPATFEGLTVDEQAMKEFKELFHGAGLSKKQFAVTVKKYAEYERARVAGFVEQQRQEQVQGMQSLAKEWGPEFDANIALANDTVEALADPDLKSLLENNAQLANTPAIIKLFTKLGKAMSEDSLKGISATGTGFNPGSKAEALQQLQELENNNVDILYNKNYPDMAKREALLKRRMELYAIAYPPVKNS